MDPRQTLLEEWLPAALQKAFASQGWGPVPEGRLRPASADASFRRYFRWSDGTHSLVIMDAPPQQEDSTPFVKVAGLLAEAGVRVPAIFSADIENGLLLLEDLGASTFLESIQAGITEQEQDRLFSDAITILVRWQKTSRPGILPEYDDAVLRRELALFPDWFVGRHIGRELLPEEAADWDQLCAVLLGSILNEAKVYVHRDYMPRNLMTSSGEPGVLDFQDALYGPVSYDVTCLFADAFFSWSPDRREAWLRQYWQQAREAGLPVPEQCELFLNQSRLMGVQRHLKVLGIFARIRYRDGKPHYLEDAPRFVRYLQQACAEDPGLAPLSRLLNSLGLQA
ncbi:MAG TPA: aminoglycoside phosphotransferase [Pseudomonas xinjiangensis]|uniref:Aminoglycoside phosphotransferase n=2 Tax=root TaxID=1 RepID=A0A7V1BKM7_9GAMM|nr:aminoglycoside phosphotransferase [Halopseudomonas xinjiangensis]HEC46023.1 aminoglycoside phosphotransferase [Halopseudomonas xinjiangensis]